MAINRYDNSFSLYSASADNNLYAKYSSGDRFINFGSGAFYHKRWKNYDYPGQSTYYKNLQGRDGKSFHSINLCAHDLAVHEDSESVALIYCSHTLEHLDRASSVRFLNECFRILKKGGVMRLALPNTKSGFSKIKCVNSQQSVSENIKKNYFRDAATQIIGAASKLDDKTLFELLIESDFDSESFYGIFVQRYQGSDDFDENNSEKHINYWDVANLLVLTKEIGFKSVIPTYQNSSVAAPFTNPHVFDTTESHISFYVDIIK